MKQLYRSTTDRKIAGVCGGIAEYLEMDPTAVRLIFAAVSLFSGVGILAYIAAVIIIPEREDMIIKQ
jgi:phage shock protein C